MKPFSFRGELPASKSILNRLLLIREHGQNHGSDVKIIGHSSCADVRHMRKALESFQLNREMDCGEAGLVLRLLTAFASRHPGKTVLRGTSRLLSRPQHALFSVLEALGARIRHGSDHFAVESEGWVIPSSPLRLDRSVSSQFASAIILNAWNLEKPLILDLGQPGVSEGYLEMSLAFVRKFGMKYERNKNLLTIPAHQKVRPGTYEAECDLSSAFAISALAAVGGYAEIRNYPRNSLQPDRVFPAILAEMGVELRLEDQVLIVHKTERLRPIEQDLRESPDLFPVLAVLCAFAEGRSILRGAPQLVHKESDRIAAAGRLLSLLGRSFEAKPDGMIIDGSAPSAKEIASFTPIFFDPDQDHRLVMAAAVAQKLGFPVTVTRPEAVDKSFPDFRSIAWEHH